MADPISILPPELRKHFRLASDGRGIEPVGEFFAVIEEAPDYAVGRDGTIVRIAPKARTRAGKVMKHWFMAGYPCVDLRTRDGVILKRLVHRVVCRTFKGPPPSEGMEVAHCDGNPSNCSADNLRWATHVQNEADKIAHGTKPARTHSKLTEADVRRIRAAPARRGVVCQLAREYGVVHQTISDIRLGKLWVNTA